MKSFNRLHRELGYPTELLKKLAADPSSYYRLRLETKSDGRQRELRIPREPLKKVQKAIARMVLRQHPISRSAHAFTKRRSVVTNSGAHLRSRHHLVIDIRDFFPSINPQNVYAVFSRCGFTPDVSRLLTLLCTIDGQLPQGSPSSPAISNLVCYEMDVAFEEFCEKHGLIYTRYADDIALSSREPLKHLVDDLLLIVVDRGFRLKHSKIHYKIGRFNITGIEVWRSKLRTSKDFNKRMEAAEGESLTGYRSFKRYVEKSPEAYRP